ncbi:MAG: hypothetical protein PHS14_21225 [Elusimicrobia bacterium]|nr:hypothetical protein [Elusimicrobiota bacterium]
MSATEENQTRAQLHHDLKTRQGQLENCQAALADRDKGMIEAVNEAALLRKDLDGSLDAHSRALGALAVERAEHAATIVLMVREQRELERVSGLLNKANLDRREAEGRTWAAERRILELESRARAPWWAWLLGTGRAL